MITKTISYVDFNGKKRTEDFYFHLSKPELLELDASYEGGWNAHLMRVINANNNSEIFRTVKEFILKAFGIKTEDGRRIRKVDDNGRPLYIAFEESPAYETLLMELCLGPDSAKNVADFVNGVVPADIRDGDVTPAAISAAN